MLRSIQVVKSCSRDHVILVITSSRLANQGREWVDGSWVMGQMGHENRMGHMGHGSLGVDP